jgi:ribokinase
MILVAGSANLDFVVRAHHIPGPGETVLGREFTTYPGGKGANQAVAAARAAGVATQMLVALGNDTYCRPLEDSLLHANVDLRVVRIPGQSTGTAFICVSDDAENAITVAPGANAHLLSTHLPALQGVTHLLMQLEIPIPTVSAFAQSAHAQGVSVVLNAAPAQTLCAELLALVNVLLVNEGELAALTGHTGTIADKLNRIAVPTVVVTLGHRGCCARHGKEFFLQKAFPVQPLDSTGAGDTFCGVLVGALSQGEGLGQALRRSSAAAALACTKLGALSSIPTQAEVSAFLSEQAPQTQADVADLRTFCGLP